MTRQLEEGFAGRFYTEHKFSFETSLTTTGKMFDKETASYDVVWSAGGGEASQLVSVLVSFYNTSPATHYLRVQVPESYPSDPFSLASWKLLSQSNRAPRQARKSQGTKKNSKKNKGRQSVRRKGVDDFAELCLVLKPRQTVRRLFRGWSKNLRPRWTAGSADTGGGFGVHLFSFVAFCEGVTDTGNALPASGAAITINTSVRCRTTKTNEGAVPNGAYLRKVDGWSQLDFIDPYPALSPRVNDLILNTGGVSYARLAITNGMQIRLDFFDVCGNKTATPIGLNAEYIYTTPLAIVDEVQGTTKESVVLYNQIGFVSNGWYYGALTYAAADKRANFGAHKFASDPGLKVLPGDAVLTVFSRKNSMAMPKLQGLHIPKISVTHDVVGRTRTGGLRASYGVVAVTPITVLVFIYKVLQLAVSYWDKPEAADGVEGEETTDVADAQSHGFEIVKQGGLTGSV